MKKILLFLTVSIFILSTSTKANIIEWGQFNGWEIGIMENENYSCYAMSPSYEDGSLLKLGYDNTDNPSAPFYLYLGNLNWDSLKDGDTYPITINFSPFKSIYDGDSSVSQVGSFAYLYFEIADPDFVLDFAEKDAIEFFYRESSIANLSLDGSYVAIQEMLNCIEAVEQSGISNVAAERKLKRKSSRDPFSD